MIVYTNGLMLFCRRILIDTGSGGSSEYVEHLKEVLSNNESSIQEILITHWHPDHVGGILDVLECTENPGPKQYFNVSIVDSSSMDECGDRPFAGSGHMVRNKLYWDANDAVGLSKQRKVGLDW